MSTQILGNVSHWKRSSPIPTDPCYQVAQLSQSSNVSLKGPISSDPGINSARSSSSSNFSSQYFSTLLNYISVILFATESQIDG